MSYGMKTLGTPLVKLNRSGIWRLLRVYVRGHRTAFALGIAFALVKSLMPLVVIWAVARIVDVLGQLERHELSAVSARLAVVHFVLLGAAAFLGAIVPTYLRDAVPARAAREIIRDIRCDLYAHLHRLSHSYFDSNRSGALAGRLFTDVATIEPFLKVCIQFPMAVILTLVVLAYFFTQNGILALLSVALLPCQAIARQAISKRMKRHTGKLLAHTAGLSGSAQERLSAAAVVKSFTREASEVERFLGESQPIVELGTRISRLAGMSQVVSQSLQMLSPLAFALVGGLLATAPGSHVTVGMLIQFILMQGRILQPMIWMLEMQSVIATAQAGAERIFETLDVQPDVQDRAGAVVMPAVEGDIRLENVTFAYPSTAQPVFAGLSLHVPAHATVALVGPSGAGKTTIAALLCRFYDVSGGRIALDGRDVRDLTLGSLRSHIALVPQDPVLFAGTVFDNILYGRRQATPAEVREAARRAYAHDFIMKLRHGYEELIGERGTKLSGGQRQRIAIARAFLKDPPIIIMDEATSALDTVSERLVAKALDELMKGRTTILIAHRLSTIRHADRIVVLDRGCIVEQGNHTELLAAGGLYATLYRSHDQERLRMRTDPFETDVAPSTQGSA